MDPRRQRTRERLRGAVLELAAAKPIERVTVAELARAAGVMRDTVYRHTPGPVELLAEVLGE
ncbi:MAG: helix-turn-helix domain-containing protein, partial [Microbacterium sp.]